jgi:hypothetical protein
MWGAVLFFVFVCAGEAIAGGSGNHRRVGLRRAVPDHVVAYAALESPERGAGWGRFVVRDAALPSREERALQVSVFGLDPGARYLVEADGIEVGAIVTDRKGDGSLKLETTGRGLHDVLSGLPPADDMVGAGIRDTWGTVILDGYFRVVRAHISDPTVHSEKIHLEDETEGDARGMAAVCRKESGAQGFATMAAGLEPGLLYTIVVDTIEVGIVTADEEGQGGLELRVPAEEDLLPDALQPVDEIRHVQWFQGELLLLSGVFSGESETDDRCHEVEGRFAGLTDDGFILRKGDADLEVVVTSETEFGGFDNLAQLEEGDWLEVRGCWDDEQFVAESVGFEEPEPECDTFLGEILERIDGGFVLQVGDEAIEVHVTEETIFSGFEDLEDLDDGDIVKIRGCFEAEVIVAAWVGLLEDDDCIELRGIVAERTDRGFVLQVGEDFIEVVVTDETRLKNFESLGELDGGEKVALEGCFDGDVLVAAWVYLVEDDDCVELHGIVAERTDHGFLLQVGEDFIEVVVTDETRLKGFESLDELDGGEAVVLEGCFDGDVLVAVWVCLVEDDDCVELHGVVAERTDLGFVLQVGDDFVDVAVTDETVFKDFESLEQLDGGETVALEGCFDGEVLVAAWVRLLEDDDVLEWWVADGTVVGLLEDGFAFEADGEEVIVILTEETVLDGYEDAGQIAVDDVVLVEGWCDGEKVFAERVMRGGQ